VTSQRGFSLLELLVAAMAGTLVLAGLFSLYLATARSLAESNTQIVLQRQGALAMEQIGRQVRGAVGPDAISLVTCNETANSVQVATAAGKVCYYAGSDGALCEFWGTRCRNLLAGGLRTIVLLTQSAMPDPRCPSGIPADAPCLSVTPNATYPTSQVDVAFAIRDRDSDVDGVTAMSFTISLTCRGRNC
jgi:prepilin-type N-terminal cleavage/methylation domain-containing protein